MVVLGHPGSRESKETIMSESYKDKAVDAAEAAGEKAKEAGRAVADKAS
jgi:hypothetical protein